jgi:cell division protein FtsL
MKKIDFKQLWQAAKRAFSHIDMVIYITAVTIGLVVAIIVLNGIVATAYAASANHSSSNNTTQLDSTLKKLLDESRTSLQNPSRPTPTPRYNPFGE